MGTLKKCIITRYDDTITEPPFLTIPIDSVNVMQPENDYSGEKMADILIKACKQKGYFFKFYTSSDDKENYDYELVVF
jgi:hypothetical protein